MNWKEYGEYEELNKHIRYSPAPMVTVICNVYNFAEFIKDALDGVLRQETDFEIEILVIDDASTDTSPEIIRAYCDKYPDKMHAFLFKENLYGTLDNINAAKHEISFFKESIRSKYVAYCEGDDYWTEPKKLKIQIEYMEDHPDCMLTMHDAIKHNYKDGSHLLMKAGEPEHNIGMKELVLQETGIWPTASMVFRKEVALCPIWMLSCGVGDWPRQLYALTLGKVHYFDKNMCVYRYMHAGSWSAGVNVSPQKIWDHASEMTAFLRKYKAAVGDEYTDVITVRANRFYEHAYTALNEHGMSTFETWENDKLSDSTTFFFDTLSSLYYQREYKYFISSELRNLLRKSEKIYVYGKGYYSEILTSQFFNNGVNIAGYILSKTRENERSANTFTVDDAPVSDKDCVVVAVGARGYLEIKEHLQKRKVRHFAFPFVAEAESCGY